MSQLRSPAFVTEKAAKEKHEFYIPRLSREYAEWIRKKVRFMSNATNENPADFPYDIAFKFASWISAEKVLESGEKPLDDWQI